MRFCYNIANVNIILILCSETENLLITFLMFFNIVFYNNGQVLESVGFYACNFVIFQDCFKF